MLVFGYRANADPTTSRNRMEEGVEVLVHCGATERVAPVVISGDYSIFYIATQSRAHSNSRRRVDGAVVRPRWWLVRFRSLHQREQADMG